MQKVIAKINLKNIQDNARIFKKQMKNKLCAVVKANAYGHGAEEVVNALEGIVDCFAVALIEEAIRIRLAACGKDILIFTPPLTEEEAVCMIENGFIATVSDLFTAKLIFSACQKCKKHARIHLKINTGMNRYGMNISMLGKLCNLFQTQPLVEIDGLYSHLYECNAETAERQRRVFLKAVRLCKGYYPNATAHLGGTYAAMIGKEFAFDMTRIGIGLYGYLPVESKEFKLKKAMKVYARVVSNRKYSFGGMGYGKIPKTDEKVKFLSIVRFGYADGFLRNKDNGTVTYSKNANNLCMDVCITKQKKRRGSLVPILLNADETAKKTGTISYEVLCAATRRAEFIYENK